MTKSLLRRLSTVIFIPLFHQDGFTPLDACLLRHHGKKDAAQELMKAGALCKHEQVRPALRSGLLTLLVRVQSGQTPWDQIQFSRPGVAKLGQTSVTHGMVPAPLATQQFSVRVRTLLLA